MRESNILLYETEAGKINIDIILCDETIWLNQKGMAELFGVNIPAINKHLINIYNEYELVASSTIFKKKEIVMLKERSIFVILMQ